MGVADNQPSKLPRTLAYFCRLVNGAKSVVLYNLPGLLRIDQIKCSESIYVSRLMPSVKDLPHESISEGAASGMFTAEGSEEAGTHRS